MALADSHSDDLPMTSPELYEDLDFRQSLMERAERGGTLLQQLARDTARHTAEVATSSVAPQEADLALKQERYKLYETERGLAQRARLHAEFDLDALGQQVDAIRDLRDPVEQRMRINRLRAQYSHFRTDPVLTRAIDSQLDALTPIVEENRMGYVQERIAANRYARTLEEASARFPGYLIRTEMLPTGQDSRGQTQFSPIYVAEDRVDPRLEAEAFQRLRLVSAGQDPSRPEEFQKALEELVKFPSVSAILAVPNSRFSETYMAALNSSQLGKGLPVTVSGQPKFDQQKGNSTQHSSDVLRLDAVRRGIVDAKTTIYGPLSQEEADRMNKYLEIQTNAANATTGLAAGYAVRHPVLGPAIALGLGLAGPYPSRPELRLGDVLAITSGNVYLRKKSGIPVSSFLDVRAINNGGRPFINDTGMDKFEGAEAALLYETSAAVGADSQPGVRIYKDDKGVIRFEPVVEKRESK